MLELGTSRAAAALGFGRRGGHLEPGKLANLAVVALPDRDAADPHELLLDSDRPVVGRYYRGATAGDKPRRLASFARVSLWILQRMLGF